jgi:predicted metalloprotease with PDZ domain
VKRIHSSLLGPFDYTQRVKTTSLWLAEGITEYYAHTLLTRYNILPPSTFYNTIGEWLQVMKSMPDTSAAYKKSLEQLSIDESDFKFDEATLFYIKGPLVGLMLDLEIRKQTNDKYNLDTVMLALNRLAQKGKTFKDEDLIKTVGQLGHADLTDFYNRYIHGTDTLPIDSYLALMGVQRSPSDADNPDLQSQQFRKEGAMLIKLNAPAEAQAMRKEIVGD